jgi:unsaturated rhamnogalacturonyl hydrolase
MRRGEGTVARDFPTTWMSYVEPPQGESGQIGCGVLGAEAGEFVEGEGQNLLVREHPSNRPFVYYAGAYWSKAPDFRAPDEWGLYLAAFSRRAGAPLGVQVLPATAALQQ